MGFCGTSSSSVTFERVIWHCCLSWSTSSSDGSCCNGEFGDDGGLWAVRGCFRIWSGAPESLKGGWAAGLTYLLLSGASVACSWLLPFGSLGAVFTLFGMLDLLWLDKVPVSFRSSPADRFPSWARQHQVWKTRDLTTWVESSQEEASASFNSRQERPSSQSKFKLRGCWTWAVDCGDGALQAHSASWASHNGISP